MKLCLLSVLILFGSMVSVLAQTDRVFWSDTALSCRAESLPFTVTRVHPELRFRNPVEIVADPISATGLFVLEVSGKVYHCDGEERHLVADLQDEIPKVNQLYGWAFHPNYQTNRLVYLCYVLSGEEPNGSIVSEFFLGENALGKPELDLSSERKIITWRGGGHNGGSLQFGHDGYLYISTGDGAGPTPPDIRRTGQDCSDLLSSILRLDVDGWDPGLSYRIPSDNPFNDTTWARPEIWAFGFRNPWRMSIDAKSGDLWVGDVGWDTWEYIFRVQRGGNYGWSVMEARQPINVTWPRGPAPILPAVSEHSHAEARSITGGYVYWGQEFPELYGQYIYGDYETGKIWGLTQKQDRWSRSELADTTLRVVCFGIDQEGELLVVDHGGGLYRLKRMESSTSKIGLPSLLSETGLFDSLNPLRPAPGVQPYTIQNPRWADGLESQRWLALPTDQSVSLGRRGGFPDGTVLVKTLALPESGQRVETQILQRFEESWRTFSYAWNKDQTDATLVPKHGTQRMIPSSDRVVGERQRWSHAGRAECASCHHHHAGFVLGFDRQQLGLQQVDNLMKGGYLRSSRQRRRRGAEVPEATAAAATVETAARDYLHVNCAHCHRADGGGLVPLDLRRYLPNEQLKAIGVAPQRGDFGLTEAQVIVSGAPERSTLYYRLATFGSGHMPHLGSTSVDRKGLALVRAWIKGMPKDSSPKELSVVSKALLTIHDPTQEQRKLGLASDDPLLRDLFQNLVPAMAEQSDQDRQPNDRMAGLSGDPVEGHKIMLGFKGAICLTCHQLGKTGQALGPALDGVGSRLSESELLEALLEPSKAIAAAYLSYKVETTTGNAIQGFLEHHDGEHLVLRQAASMEATVAISDIVTMSVSDQSMMPAGLLQVFSAQESADLLAFLRSLK